MKYSSISISKGLMGYVLIIAFTLIIYPNEQEFAIRLADHMIYFFIFWMGACLMDIISLILSFVSRRSSKKETER